MNTIKRSIQKTPAILFFLTLFLFSACTKDGPAGPAGEQGPPGTTGQQGAKGDKGDKGNEGNANVKVFTQDISKSTWTMVGSSTNGYLKLDISAPQVLTTDVVTNWVNLVYVHTSDATGPWFLLPYYSERDIRVTADVQTGKLTLKRDQEGKPYTQSWFNTVKVVCIKPSSVGTLARQSGPPPDYSDYKAVCRYYGISE